MITVEEGDQRELVATDLKMVRAILKHVLEPKGEAKKMLRDI